MNHFGDRMEALVIAQGVRPRHGIEVVALLSFHPVWL
jgi:hypothetical protein